MHFGRLRLTVAPALGGSFTSPAPLPAGSTMPLDRTYAGGVSTFGEAGNWSLDTTGMPKKQAIFAKFTEIRGRCWPRVGRSKIDWYRNLYLQHQSHTITVEILWECFSKSLAIPD